MSKVKKIFVFQKGEHTAIPPFFNKKDEEAIKEVPFCFNV
jgi:hypothetical protein